MTVARIEDVAAGFLQVATDTKAIARDVGPTRDQYASLAAAVTANPGETIRIGYDDTALPTDFRDVLLEYTAQASVRSLQLRSFTASKAQKVYRAQAGPHSGRTERAVHVEMLAEGSTQNGPHGATIGQSIYAAKRDFSSGRAVGGEMDGLEIVVRQDGPDGLPSRDPGSSDAAGIMVNAQNVGTCGFVAIMDATASNVSRDAGFPLDVALQVQLGVIDANHAEGKVSFGIATVANAGEQRAAFHAGIKPGSGATWRYLLQGDRFRVLWGGDIQFRDPAAYPDWAAHIRRASGADGQMLVQNQGAGGLLIGTVGAGRIDLATNNITRWQIQGSGSFLPATDNGSEIGSATRRVSRAHLTELVLYGAVATMDALPTSDPGVKGRLWRDAANGNVLKVSP